MESEAHSDLDFTHLDQDGRPRIVDVSAKPETQRIAVARAVIEMKQETRARIEARAIQKGDVLAIAELAGIMAAKRTPDLIPLCHPVPLTNVQLQHRWLRPSTDASTPPSTAAQEPGTTAWLLLEATVAAIYRTGVEMEALVACTSAALTVYDMCKAVDRGMVIRDVRLVYKAGGQRGTFDIRASTSESS